MNIDELVAIDVHTHAEEPCQPHRDDGYNEFQEGMRNYFRTGRDYPPAMDETAAYLRERSIGCVIFPVDAQRETGFRGYSNTLLKRKVLLGSDWPAITPDRWFADFETINIRDEVKPGILKGNAAKLLGLTSEAA